eukprot:scaffold325089_cov58-Tisochrysis_lutea.AAC.2
MSKCGCTITEDTSDEGRRCAGWANADADSAATAVRSQPSREVRHVMQSKMSAIAEPVAPPASVNGWSLLST